MLKKRKVVREGDSRFLPGQVADKFEFEDENTRVRESDPPGTEATADWVLLGITEASLATDSFLSAASFQKTTRVLTDAAVKGKRDNLVGLKENVIIGRLIPAGTGLPRYRALEVELEGGMITYTTPMGLLEEEGEIDEEAVELLMSGAVDKPASIADVVEALKQTDSASEDADEAEEPTDEVQVSEESEGAI